MISTCLVATSSGIIKVDPRAGQATWALLLKGCGGALFIQQDRRLLATRGNGVVYGQTEVFTSRRADFPIRAGFWVVPMILRGSLILTTDL
jgi:hypothetical protein